MVFELLRVKQGRVSDGCIQLARSEHSLVVSVVHDMKDNKFQCRAMIVAVRILVEEVVELQLTCKSKDRLRREFGMAVG